MKNYKDVAEEYFNENWWCSKLEQNYVLSLPFPSTKQHKREAKYPSENQGLCHRTLFSFPVPRSTLLRGCLLISRQPAKKSRSNSSETRQGSRISLQDVWCQAGLSRCWDIHGRGCSRAGDAWQGELFLDGSSTSPKSTLLSFQMMALNGASKYLPAPKAASQAGRAAMQGCKNNQHFQVAVRREICRNSARLTSASSNNRVHAPRNAGVLVFEHFSFLPCRYIKEKGHGVITRIKCSTTVTSKKGLPTHSPVFLQNLSLLMKLLTMKLSCEGMETE